MPFSTFDLTVMAAIFAAALVGGFVPMRMSRQGGQRFFRLANAFAAGMFLGIGLLHMLPESAEILDGLVDYPLAPLLALLGLTILLSLDRIAFAERPQAQYSASSRPWIVLAALSVHSLVVGVALGLEPEFIGSLAIFAAILIHKASDSFALIVNVHAEGVAVARQKAMLGFFSLVTPAGIAIGSAAASGVAGGGAAAEAAAGSVGAFAAGTLVYIAIVVILDREFARHKAAAPPVDKDLWTRFGLIFVGIALMAVFAGGDVHSDRHGGGHGPQAAAGAVDSAHDANRAEPEEAPPP